jgi:hypothetical protein
LNPAAHYVQLFLLPEQVKHTKGSGGAHTHVSLFKVNPSLHPVQISASVEQFLHPT